MKTWIGLLLIAFTGCVHVDETENPYAACQRCHTPKELQRGPRIDGLPAWYVEHQLELFKSGERGRNSKNRSEHLMGSTRKKLAKIDIAAMADYVASLPVVKHEPVIQGDLERGKEIFAHCATCHGDDGQGKPDLLAPPLEHFEDWYQLDQLRKFKKGIRGSDPKDLHGHPMYLSVQQYSDKDLKAVVAYIARRTGDE